jgi:hypothetical protein
MKKLGTTVLSAIAIMIFAGSAFAETPKKVKIPMAVTLNGTAIPEGQYNLTITDDGQVTLASGKKILVTAQGKLVNHDKKAESDSILVSQQPNGTQKLTEINFGGQKSSIVFAEAESKTSGN